jgi:hypothetical protein
LWNVLRKKHQCSTKESKEGYEGSLHFLSKGELIKEKGEIFFSIIKVIIFELV